MKQLLTVLICSLMLVSGKASKFEFYTVDHDEKREGAMHIRMSEVFVKIKPYYMEDDESQIFPLGTFSFRYLAFGYGKNTIDSGVVHFFNDHEALVLQNFFYHSVRDSQELFIRYFQCFCIEYAGKCWQVLTNMLSCTSLDEGLKELTEDYEKIDLSKIGEENLNQIMNLVRVRQRAEAVKEEQAAKVRAEIPFTIEFKEGVRMQESQTLQRLRSWRAYLETL